MIHPLPLRSLSHPQRVYAEFRLNYLFTIFAKSVVFDCGPTLKVAVIKKKIFLEMQHHFNYKAPDPKCLTTYRVLR